MKKILSAVLCALLLLSLFVPCVSAKKAARKGYPFVFVNGMMGWGSYDAEYKSTPYWGGKGGDVIRPLSNEGYECYAASVGKISSNWDRMCELYAQLTGTVVDYGEAHSKKCKHKRFGRSYKGKALCNYLGKKDKNGKLIKLNLVGYSMGGPTIRLFVWMLENGDKEECKASGKRVSPLFKGGKGSYINSITTLAAPHNGTPVANTLYSKGGVPFLLGVMSTAPVDNKWDYQLEQYGFSKGIGGISLRGINKMARYKDNCGCDLTIGGAKRLNEKIGLVKGVYYFSYVAQKVKKKGNGTYAPRSTMYPSFEKFSSTMGKFNGQVYDGVKMTADWRENDGLVPVISASAPFTEKSRTYKKGMKLKPSIWHVMPKINNFDHMDFQGAQSKKSLVPFYRDILKTVNSAR